MALDNRGVSVKDFWRKFDIKAAVEIIAAAWEEVKSSTMNAVWRKVWPEAVHSFVRFDHVPLQQEIDDFANAADLVAEGEERINADDIAALVESHEEDLTAEDLVELQKQQTAVEEEEQTTSEKTTTMGDLKELIKLGLSFIDEVLARDGDVDRSFRVRSSMKALLSPYEEELRQKRSKTKHGDLLNFFSPRQPPAKISKTASLQSATTTAKVRRPRSERRRSPCA